MKPIGIVSIALGMGVLCGALSSQIAAMVREQKASWLSGPNCSIEAQKVAVGKLFGYPEVALMFRCAGSVGMKMRTGIGQCSTSNHDICYIVGFELSEPYGKEDVKSTGKCAIYTWIGKQYLHFNGVYRCDDRMQVSRWDN